MKRQRRLALIILDEQAKNDAHEELKKLKPLLRKSKPAPLPTKKPPRQ